MIWPSAVALTNARVATPHGVADAIRFSSRVLALGDPPRRGDAVIDLAGALVLPGLMNAHDHLELNHYGRLKCRDVYRNASEWIDDLRPRLSEDPAIRAGRAYPLVERLFIGALKNLLSGVTTVAHHNPLYAELRRTIPIRVVRRYGWAHSFELEREPAGARGEPGGDVADRWRGTPSDAPFMVHLGEGVDAAAAGELPRLEALGCLQSNTLIVHGIALDGNGLRRMARAGAGLVWCPGSNMFLFGRTANVRELLDLNRPSPSVALGTDSRLTGSRDLLDELRCARDAAPTTAAELFAMVTTAAAALLRYPRGGRIAVGAPADLLVLPAATAGHPADVSAEHLAGTALLAATRRDVRLVVVGGRPLVGHPEFARLFGARRVSVHQLRVDGAPKIAESGLARRIAGCPIVEAGVIAA
jgi:cytosine/adenosine deaminase-related metal-dependent hydrolase